MKLLAIGLFIYFPIISFAQDAIIPTNSQGNVSYSEVVQVDSSNASSLFGKARLFVSKAFNSGKAVTDLTDVENKTVLTKGWAPLIIKQLGIPYKFECWFTMTIQCKDHKYKYTFDDFDVLYKNEYGKTTMHYNINSSEKPKGYNKKQWENAREHVDLHMKDLILDLKKQMNKTDSDF